MNRRRSTPFQYEHPATYAEFVAEENRVHLHRIAELKAAQKTIIAIEPDLAALVARKIYYSIDKYSLYMLDWFSASGSPAKKALVLRFSYLSESADTATSIFLERGWIVEDAKLERHHAKILLRRPKTRVRITLECSGVFAKQISPQPDTETPQ